MWDILRLPHRRIRVSLCLEDEDKMVWRVKSIRYLCRLTFAYLLPRLRTSVYELVWAMGFELNFSVYMETGSPIIYPLEYSINMFIGLALENSFGTWDVSLVGVSLGPIYGLMTVTEEVSLVWLSLGLALGSPFGYPNPGLTVIIPVLSLWNNLESLLEYIWNINCCCPWIGTWWLLWSFNWFPSFLFSLPGTWHTYWHADGIFTCLFFG